MSQVHLENKTIKIKRKMIVEALVYPAGRNKQNYLEKLFQLLAQLICFNVRIVTNN